MTSFRIDKFLMTVWLRTEDGSYTAMRSRAVNSEAEIDFRKGTVDSRDLEHSSHFTFAQTNSIRTSGLFQNEAHQKAHHE